MINEDYNKLRVIEKTEEVIEKTITPEFSRHINPMYRSILKFHHEKIGEKFSLKDLF